MMDNDTLHCLSRHVMRAYVIGVLLVRNVFVLVNNKENRFILNFITSCYGAVTSVSAATKPDLAGGKCGA